MGAVLVALQYDPSEKETRWVHLHSLSVVHKRWISVTCSLDRQILSTQVYPEGYRDGVPWELGRLAALASR